jgi:SAM-dependent methyltransferase
VRGFTADWLALREPHDLSARNSTVLQVVVAALAHKGSIDVLDLACGTGSTLRAVAPQVKSKQRWRLIDHDVTLLAHAAAMPLPREVTVTTFPIDLNGNLEAVFNDAIDLVTTSALLDLVSEAWLDELAREAARRAAPVYAALSYDGLVEISPVHSMDATVVAAVNLHQCRDKGFGPALGPDAASVAIAQFESLGYSVVQGRSDWTIGPQDRQFQTEILSGWASAVREVGTLSSVDIKEWLRWRADAVAAGHSSIRVGHVDIFADPSAMR